MFDFIVKFVINWRSRWCLWQIETFAKLIQPDKYWLKRITPCEPIPNKANCLPYNLCWRQWAATGHKAHPFSRTLPPGRWAATLPPSVGHSVWGCRRMHTVPHRRLHKGGGNHIKVIKLDQNKWMATVRIAHLGLFTWPTMLTMPHCNHSLCNICY